MTCKEFQSLYRQGLLLQTNAEVAAARKHYKICRPCQRWEEAYYKKIRPDGLPGDLKLACAVICKEKNDAISQDPECQ